MSSSEIAEVKPDRSAASVLICCLCLVSESDVKLSFVDLTEFYSFFKPCGIGLNICGQAHYNYTCQFCERRAGQCLRFIKTVRSAEDIFNVFLQNEPAVTNELLQSVCKHRISLPFNLSSWLINDCRDSFLQSTSETNEGRFSEIRVELTSLDNPPHFGYENSASDIVKWYKQPHESGTNCDNDLKSLKTDPNLCAYSALDETWSAEEDGANRPREISDAKSAPRSQKAKSWLPLDVQPLQLSREQQLAELRSRLLDVRFLSREFKCYKCAVSFHERQCLEAHEDLHKQERGEFVCEICTRHFSSQCSLQMHRAGHRNRWKCLRCGEFLSNKNQMLVHYAACASSDPLQCNFCKKLYKNRVSLKKHVSKIHNNKNRYTCDVCDKTFKLKQLIIYHMRIHTKEKPYTCNVCGKKSATSSSHKSHMKIHERSSEDDPDLYCVECDKHFKNKYIMRTHYNITLKHNTHQSFRHKCPECDARFAMPSSVRLHRQRVHARARLSQCQICDRAYPCAQSLAAHVRAKHRQPPARDKVCAVCGKAFTSGSALKTHSRMHTLERPYRCVVCSATFSFNSALYRHTKLKHHTTTAELRRKMAAEGQVKQGCS